MLSRYAAGTKVKLHLFLTLPFMEVSGQIHALAAFHQGEKALIPIEH